MWTFIVQIDMVYISIYDSDNDEYYNDTFKCIANSRMENKRLVIDKIIKILADIIK